MIPRLSFGLLLATLMVLPAGCVLYGIDDDDCAEPAIFRLGQRNPYNGICSGGGGGGGCGDQILPLAEGTSGALADWASCPGPCEGQSESTCLANPECRATYLDCPPGSNCLLPWSFHECWGIAPSGPDLSRVACEGLDAYQCSRRNNCTAHYLWSAYFESPQATLEFVGCAAEEPEQRGCYSDAECPMGWDCTADTECLPPPGCDPGEVCPAVCYGRCVPPTTNVCETVDCMPGMHCEERCFPCDPVPGMECPPNPWCEPICVPDAPQTCETVDCGPGFHCEETCVPPPPGCLGGPIGCPERCSVACEPNIDPGDCARMVACDSLPPMCPLGTVPGARNGCWTGFCIPREQCE